MLNKGLRVSELEDEVRVVARAEVLSALRQLDGERKGRLIQFLSEATLIGNDQIISLHDADLSFAHLHGAFLDGADLSQAHMHGADLSGADLIFADLSAADLSGASLIFADLSGADLSGAYLVGVDLRMAKVSNEQLAQAKSLHEAYMPDASYHP